MNTAEVAGYLRLGPRKIYDLVRQRGIPHVRVSGKLLFPRRLIQLWLEQNTDFPAASLRTAPAVVAGSQDPLLEWAVRESRCGLALLMDGSENGLKRLADGQAVAAGAHLIDADGEYNIAAVRRLAPFGDIVIVEWARREQGLLMRREDRKRLATLPDVAAKRARVQQRQEGAGGQVLLRHLAGAAKLNLRRLRLTEERARTDSDLAAAIVHGRADCGIAIRAVARQHGLEFAPMQRERFDLVMRRRDYFEGPIQSLLRFTRTTAFAKHAEELEGYELAGAGEIVFNS